MAGDNAPSRLRATEPVVVSRRTRIAVRAFDLAVGVPVALLATPVILVAAVVAAGCLRTWPFFVQVRVGRAGRLFRCVKIRTLPSATPTSLDKYTVSTHVTSRACRFLRRTHLDELPQLWLVVWGTMSMVGPRPEMPALARLAAPEVRAVRESVKPGCTGLWQVSEAQTRLLHEVPEYDLAYVRGRTLRLDVWLLWRTAVDLTGRRPISLDDVPAWTGLEHAIASTPTLALGERAA